MKQQINKTSQYLIILVAILLPWDTIIGNIVLAITTIYSLFFIFKHNLFRETFFNYKYFISSSIILIYIIGIFYSSNVTYGLSFVETTIALLFFPLFFAGIYFSKKNLEMIILAFIYSYTARGLLVVFLLSKEIIGNGLKSNWYFQKIESLGGFHTTYMGLYSIVSIILLLYLTTQKKNIAIFYSLILFHIFFLFLLASRMAIVTLLLIAIIYLVYLFIIQKEKRKIILSFSLISIIIVVIMFSNNHDLRYKFYQLKNIKDFKYNKYDASSIGSRIAKWESAMNVYHNNNKLIGTGTGDLPEDLLEQFKIIDCLQCRVKKYNNPHNQYLDSLTRNGIIGISFLLLTLFYPIVIAIKNKDVFQLMFMLTFVIMLVSECLLNREKGVQLFGLFYSFFFLLKKKE